MIFKSIAYLKAGSYLTGFLQFSLIIASLSYYIYFFTGFFSLEIQMLIIFFSSSILAADLLLIYGTYKVNVQKLSIFHNGFFSIFQEKPRYLEPWIFIQTVLIVLTGLFIMIIGLILMCPTEFLISTEVAFWLEAMLIPCFGG